MYLKRKIFILFFVASAVLAQPQNGADVGVTGAVDFSQPPYGGYPGQSGNADTTQLANSNGVGPIVQGANSDSGAITQFANKQRKGSSNPFAPSKSAPNVAPINNNPNVMGQAYNTGSAALNGQQSYYPPQPNNFGPQSYYPPQPNNYGPQSYYPPQPSNYGPQSNYPQQPNNYGPQTNYPPSSNFGPSTNGQPIITQAALVSGDTTASPSTFPPVGPPANNPSQFPSPTPRSPEILQIGKSKGGNGGIVQGANSDGSGSGGSGIIQMADSSSLVDSFFPDFLPYIQKYLMNSGNF